jgi:hypothetical protein
MRTEGTLKVLLNNRSTDLIDMKIHQSSCKAVVFGTLENDRSYTYLLKVPIYIYKLDILVQIVYRGT